jgi:hypothetical protein
MSNPNINKVEKYHPHYFKANALSPLDHTTGHALPGFLQTRLVSFSRLVDRQAAHGKHTQDLPDIGVADVNVVIASKINNYAPRSIIAILLK